MANEITLTGSMVVKKDNLIRTLSPGSIQITLTGSVGSGGPQNIGTTAEALVMGDITTAGWIFFRNLSTSTATSSIPYVEIGLSTSSFTPVVQLYPGEYTFFRAATTALVARANTSQTSTVNLDYFALQL